MNTIHVSTIHFVYDDRDTMPDKCPLYHKTSAQALKKDVIMHSALRAKYFRRYRRCSELRAIAAAYDEQSKCAYNRRMPITHEIVEAIRKKMKTLK